MSDDSLCNAGFIENYNGLRQRGALRQDSHQESVVKALDNLLQQLSEYNNSMKLYHTQLREWEASRHQLRQKILQEEAEQAAKKQIERKLAEGQKTFANIVLRWFKSLKDRLLLYESENEQHWQRRVYGPAAIQWLRAKTSKRKREPGSGRMVAHIKREERLDEILGCPPQLPQSPKGLYIYGSVGCGKTMLMDMFYNAAETFVSHRRRLHFHAALLEVHDRMHKLWKQQQQEKVDNGVLDSDDDNFEDSETVAFQKAVKKWLDDEKRFQEELQHTNIFDIVAESILSETAREGASLLCFDELQVVDVFTAVALSGIFTSLIKKGTIIVSTSNRAPGDLNKEKMQKEIFDKFVGQLQRHCEIVLLGSETDYRRLQEPDAKSDWKNYLWPLNEDTRRSLELRWQQMVSGGKAEMATVSVMFGRTLEVPCSCNGVARFTFEEICDRPVGAADYIALARNFHTVFITGIPVMSMRNRDKARRFITLIDELYNHRRQMICTAESSIDELFLGSEEGSLVDLESLQFETEAENVRSRRDVTVSGTVAPIGGTIEERRGIQFLLSGREELFAFQRAVSRLIEMQSSLYLDGKDCQVNHLSVQRVAVQ
ncbi:hypothetical protein KP509_39G021000 [Ceratopteris richardii]|uniref:AFG1-like ATPase n=1 Tax=Ceratopteris richardii TaxID=49495 RepID=A0A8T2PZH7_CERRI|nr:hypothetical protein KP509_39G021000 [Ceratopteris richardii]